MLALNKTITVPILLFNAIFRRRNWRDTDYSNLLTYPFVILGNINWQQRILKILETPAFQTISDSQPVFPVKYASNVCLSKRLTASERAASIVFHYSFLSASLDSEFLRAITTDGVTIYERTSDDRKYDLFLLFPRAPSHEGELNLSFRSNEKPIYNLTFTVINGSTVGEVNNTVILISRIQGVQGEFSLIKAATKDMKDVSPSSLLVSALSGIASALNIDRLVSVSADLHVSNEGDHLDDFYSAYDAFFMSLGAESNARDFLSLPVPLPDKAITTIRRDHRSRAMGKRRFRSAITDDVRRFICARRVPPANEQTTPTWTYEACAVNTRAPADAAIRQCLSNDDGAWLALNDAE